MPFPPHSFDVVVMINVLEHVRDADLCMRTAVDLVKPGGYFLFGNRLIAVDKLDYDPWHPIRVRQSDLDPTSTTLCRWCAESYLHTKLRGGPIRTSRI